MFQVFRNIWLVPELKNRILFTLAMLFVFRIGAHVPIPGIDSVALQSFYKNSSMGSVVNFFNTFSGGALTNLSIFALGILPYISASIIMQLMTVVFPTLERLSKEGDAGRRKITQYTRYGTIALAVVQSYAISTGIQNMRAPGGNPIVTSTLSSWAFSLVTVITLTAGTSFVMWLSEKISERGIGNGSSLIVFSGIVAGIPAGMVRTYQLVETNEMSIFAVLVILCIIVAVTAAVVMFESAQRKITINYARRMQGRQMTGGSASYLPLKINASGVIPPIFASSLLAFPSAFTAFQDKPWLRDIGLYLNPQHWFYNVIFVSLIFFFCYFYNAIQFNPIKISEDLKRYGGFIPGIRPGEKTADFLNTILGHLTFMGAIYLSVVCVLPNILYAFFNIPFHFGGTSLLIVVGVAIDLANQIETFLINQNYDGFMKKFRSRVR